ncbi:hypothetical protein EBZ97_01545 [bacterium]|nr:hypothetical protein [bacterium]
MRFNECAHTYNQHAAPLHGSGVTGSPRMSPGTLKSLIKDYDRLHPKSGGVVATWAWLLVDAVAI